MDLSRTLEAESGDTSDFSSFNAASIEAASLSSTLPDFGNFIARGIFNSIAISNTLKGNIYNIIIEICFTDFE
jgi:hypothetical protein